MNLSWNAVRGSNEENNFPLNLLLTIIQDSKLRKASANNSSGKKNYQKRNCTEKDNHEDS